MKAKEKGKILQIWKVSEKKIPYIVDSLYFNGKTGILGQQFSIRVNNTKGIWTVGSAAALHVKMADNSEKSLVLSKLNNFARLANFYIMLTVN